MRKRFWFIAALAAMAFTAYTLRTQAQTGGALHPYVYGSLVSGGDLTLDSTFNGTKGDVFINPSGGNVGVGTTSPAAGLHGVVTNGVLLWANNESDDTNKIGNWGIQHYDVTGPGEEPFYGVIHQNSSTANNLNLGGGSVGGNAATSIFFYTAANNTTTTGTEQARIDGSGYFYFTDRLVDLGDTNTYIASSGSDVLSFFTAGTDRVHINSLGQTLFEGRATDATPAMAHLGDPNTGIDFDDSFPDEMYFITAGSKKISIIDVVSVHVDMLMGSKAILFSEDATPPSGVANAVYIFARDNGSGLTQLCAEFATGAVQCFAIETP